jgi:ABC-2 type transport system ATP-binding protein
MVILVEPANPSRMDEAARLLSNDAMVQTVDVSSGTLRIMLKEYDADYSSLSTLLVNNGIAIRKFSEEEINLESAFMAFTKGAGAKI